MLSAAAPLPSLRLQDLPPRLAHQCLAVERFLREGLGHGQGDGATLDLRGARLLVACSGGPDSVALLAMLQALRVRGGFSLCAAHLDHGLRADASEDAALVGSLCSRLALPCRCARMDVTALASRQRIGLEEAGRMARLEFLETVREELGAAWIVTGHQLNDLAEDQLMRQLRGTGWPALGGMAALDPTRRILRPVLLQPRAALHDFVTMLRLPYRNDPMNDDPHFLRNRVRKEILPAMLRENPSYLAQVESLWRQARLDETQLALAMQPVFATCEIIANGLRLSSPALHTVAPAIRLRCYKAALERLGQGPPQMDALFALEAAFSAGRIGARIDFPGSVVARVTRAGVEFKAPCPAADRP
ncbi:tRNA lysidine(34) synthetase TilS [Megalodesulfovibrio paquesii]